MKVFQKALLIGLRNCDFKRDNNKSKSTVIIMIVIK